MAPRARRYGADNPNWRGGRVTDPRGYILIRQPEHPRADVRGYVYEHILIAEATLGRPLLPHEEVHHDDERKSNNNPRNLIVASSAFAHHVMHRKRDDGRQKPGEANPWVSCGCGCGTLFTKFDASGRPRAFISGHNSWKTPLENELISCACGCGETFMKYSPDGYLRRYVKGHNRTTHRSRLHQLISCACGCGQQLLDHDQYRRPRRFISGHNRRNPRHAD